MPQPRTIDSRGSEPTRVCYRVTPKGFQYEGFKYEGFKPQGFQRGFKPPFETHLYTLFKPPFKPPFNTLLTPF